MPTHDEARRFAAAATTSDEQLRNACRILGLDEDGDAGELRGRLHRYLETRPTTEPVVCLNPKLGVSKAR